MNCSVQRGVLPPTLVCGKVGLRSGSLVFSRPIQPLLLMGMGRENVELRGASDDAN